MAFMFGSRRKKSCRFTKEGGEQIDYKNVHLLKNYVMDNGKIIPSRITGTKAKYQRSLTTAIKQARFLALLHYCDKH